MGNRSRGNEKGIEMFREGKGRTSWIQKALCGRPTDLTVIYKQSSEGMIFLMQWTSLVSTREIRMHNIINIITLCNQYVAIEGCWWTLTLIGLGFRIPQTITDQSVVKLRANNFLIESKCSFWKFYKIILRLLAKIICIAFAIFCEDSF